MCLCNLNTRHVLVAERCIQCVSTGVSSTRRCVRTELVCQNPTWLVCVCVRADIFDDRLKWGSFPFSELLLYPALDCKKTQTNNLYMLLYMCVFMYFILTGAL